MEKRRTERGRPQKERRPARQRRKRNKKVRRVITTILLILVITMGMMLGMAAAYIKNVIIPQADLDVADYTAALTTTMLYKNKDTGNWETLQELHGEENRIWVELDQIPENLKNAAIAIEDKRFMEHHGVDWKRTLRGILNMFTGRDIVGGSTLTQQLIKNMTNDDEVTVKRKIMEIFRALEMEKKIDKDQILEHYLNYIYLGEGCNGVYTASYKYFGKNVSELTLAECASLIGITNNPSKYNPLAKLTVTDPETGEVTTAEDFNKQRQETILREMEEQDMITEAERDEAIAQPLDFSNGRDAQSKGKTYTWYEDAVIRQVLEDLKSTYNWSEEYAKTKLYAGGLEIYTCFDPKVQAAVDEVYANSETLNVTSASGQRLQSAITIVDNETGEVVAMAGGVGPKTGSLVLNRAVDSKRPPGSSIKPLAVYAPAIELGIVTPSSTEVDSYQDPANQWPVNATGRFQGTVTIAKAVRESINTVAVKTLEKVTPQKSYEFMRDRFHIQLVESRKQGERNFTDIALAPLALGGLTDGVSTYEMAAAYSTFPRLGTYIAPRLYSTVIDSGTREVVLENTQTVEEKALSERTAYYMNQMLKDVVNPNMPGATGRNANFSGQEIAGKTGTTTARRDLWFVGYTPYYTAAVWTGYDKQERLSTGLNNPSVTMWKNVMVKVHNGLAYKDFNQPDTSKMKSVSICSVSGMLPTSACSGHVTTGSFFPEDVPVKSCTVHVYKPPEEQTPEEEDPNAAEEPNGTDPGTTTPEQPPATADPPAQPETPAEPPAQTDPTATE